MSAAVGALALALLNEWARYVFVPHLSWTIDHLVAAAELLSGGEIEFPWQRENG